MTIPADVLARAKSLPVPELVNEVVLRSLTSLIEPVILIVLGALVGFVAVSMFLPLFDLATTANAGH